MAWALAVITGNLVVIASDETSNIIRGDKSCICTTQIFDLLLVNLDQPLNNTDRETLKVISSLSCHNFNVCALCHVKDGRACNTIETEHKRAVVIHIVANIHLEQVFVNMQMLKGFGSVRKLAASVIDVENEQVGPSLDHLFKDFLHRKEDSGLFVVSC